MDWDSLKFLKLGSQSELPQFNKRKFSNQIQAWIRVFLIQALMYLSIKNYFNKNIQLNLNLKRLILRITKPDGVSQENQRRNYQDHQLEANETLLEP